MRPDADLTAEQIVAWCAAALAGYKVPATVEFRRSLPYTHTGKLLSETEREEKARASE